MNDKKKINIFIVSIYFPPKISVATNRMLAFAKYLDKSKFNVTVVTLFDKNLDNNQFKYPTDVKIIRVKNKSLLKKVSFTNASPFIIHKLKVLFNLFYSVIVKDEFYSWRKNAIKQLYSLIDNKNQNVILSSFNPIAAHIIPYKLKTQGKNFLWIADMRDEISNNEGFAGVQKKFLTKAKQQILSKADIVTAVSVPVLNTFMKPGQKNKIIFKEIRNGYDFDISEEFNFCDVFTIAYAGTFYGKRKPTVFFKALGNLIDNKYIDDIKINFIGTGKNFLIPGKLKSNIKIIDKISYKTTIKLLQNSDSLLFIVPASANKGVFTGKIFDYLACLKPIIALVDKTDVAAELIAECNAGFIAEYNNVREVEKAILSAYQLWQKRKSLNYNIDLIRKHRRKNQVRKLEKLILNEIEH